MRRDEAASASASDEASKPWVGDLYETLRDGEIRQMCYVPDAGHAELIRLMEAEPQLDCTLLTTEQEGVAMLAGAWLGGQRGVLLMQSSGVGNCVNMLSLPAGGRFPFLTFVAMRGEWGEFNPAQYAMGGATQAAFECMGVRVLRVERAEEVVETAEAALTMAFEADQQVAVLLSQRLLGRKIWRAT